MSVQQGVQLLVKGLVLFKFFVNILIKLFQNFVFFVITAFSSQQLCLQPFQLLLGVVKHGYTSLMGSLYPKPKKM